MTSVKFQHNKKRNVGIVRECLLRSMAEAVLKQDLKAYRTALKIFREHLAPGTCLASELAVFDVVLGTRGVSDVTARGVLAEARRACSGGRTDVARAKDRLVSDIHRKMGRDVLSRYRLDEYRVLASIQLFIDGCARERTLEEGHKRVLLEDGLVAYMRSERSSQADVPMYRGLTYTNAVNLFEKRYGQALGRSQRELLAGAVRTRVSGQPLSSFVGPFRDRLTESLERALVPEMALDPAMKRRFDEARGELAMLDVSSDTCVADLMLYSQLLEEVTSDA